MKDSIPRMVPASSTHSRLRAAANMQARQPIFTPKTYSDNKSRSINNFKKIKMPDVSVGKVTHW